VPRPPKTRHFMRDIRSAIGLNQAEFAQLLGTTASTIKQIENGKMKMSRDFANRLYRETGFSADNLELIIPDSGGMTISLPGSSQPVTRYTKADYAQWKADTSKSTLGERKALAESLHQGREVLFNAAHDDKTKEDRFCSVYQSVVSAIDQTCKDFGLIGKAEKILAKCWPLKSRRGHWRPNFIAPAVSSSAPSWTMSYTHLDVKTSPSPPSSANARPASDRKSALPGRRRLDARATAKP
jgi:transcriptional regulator with XRE-family HTH domain